MWCFGHYLTGDAQIMISRKRESCLVCKEYASGTFTASVVAKQNWAKLMNDKTTISDDELFFEEKSGTKVPARKGMGRGKKSSNDLFAEVKVKMVMRVYGVTKAHALEILARQPVGLHRLTDNDSLHSLMLNIRLQEVEKFRCRNSRQPIRNNLQWVGDC